MTELQVEEDRDKSSKENKAIPWTLPKIKEKLKKIYNLL